jgi:hypothetical protein
MQYSEIKPTTLSTLSSQELEELSKKVPLELCNNFIESCEKIHEYLVTADLLKDEELCFVQSEISFRFLLTLMTEFS